MERMRPQPPACGKLFSPCLRGFSPHKLCLIGSIPIQSIITASTKGYIWTIAMFIIVFILYPSFPRATCAIPARSRSLPPRCVTTCTVFIIPCTHVTQIIRKNICSLRTKVFTQSGQAISFMPPSGFGTGSPAANAAADPIRLRSFPC